MGEQTWYRGEAAGGPASKPGGGSIHDLGEGVYYTDDPNVAKRYADTRAGKLGKPETASAYSVAIDMSSMRVLDLTRDPRWSSFLRTPIGSQTPEQLIRMANENYGRFFEVFLLQNKINLANYDAVIAQEFVRSGNQLCILLKNGRQTDLHNAIRSKSVLFYKGGIEIKPPSPTIVPAPTTQDIFRMKSPARRAAGVQGAAAAVGVALGTAIQWLGDVGIQRRVREEIETTHAKAVENILARGDGILVIVSLQEWGKADDLGRRARSLLAVYVRGGASEAAALRSWQTEAKLLVGPASGWRAFEQYAWVPPAQ